VTPVTYYDGPARPDSSVDFVGEDDFIAKAQEAKAACLVSRALAGVPEIALEARLQR
jgi:organic hydroperoxide reductase OsmC/OhrA